MRWRLEPRTAVPWWLEVVAPLAALGLTLLLSALMFAALGYPPLEALHVYLVAPVSSPSCASRRSPCCCARWG